jgi:hypothetical protein
MNKKQCWRYKCDFCGRVGYSPAHMRKHEIGCTANKNRTCRMPVHGGDPSKPVIELAAFLNRHDEDFGMKALREACSDCPACILAAIRCSGIQQGHDEGDCPDLKFNFRKELSAMWDEYNEAPE